MGSNLSPTPRVHRRELMEAMMRDELFDREYQAGRSALNASIDRMIEGMARSLRALNAIQFDAPWKHEADGASRPAR
jgi:hypothetical protein